MTDGWAERAGALSMTVDCGGEAHELTWKAGVVSAVDHPDLDAELAFVALGGDEPACLEHLRLWHDAVADGGFVLEWADDTTITARWRSWLETALVRMRTEGLHEVLRELPHARALLNARFIAAFELAWLDRAGAQVAERVAVEGGDALVVAALAEATRRRARRAFVQTLAGRHLATGPASLLPLEISVGGRPLAVGQLTGPDRGVSLTLADGWLHRVWASGTAARDGGFSLSPSVTATITPDATVST